MESRSAAHFLATDRGNLGADSPEGWWRFIVDASVQARKKMAIGYILPNLLLNRFKAVAFAHCSDFQVQRSVFGVPAIFQ